MVLNSRGKLASRNSAPEQQAVASLRTPNEWIWISLYRHPSIKRLSCRSRFPPSPAPCSPGLLPSVPLHVLVTVGELATRRFWYHDYTFTQIFFTVYVYDFLLLKSCTTVRTCEVGWKLWVDSGLCIVWYHTYPDYHITCYQNWSTNRRLTAQTVYLSSLSAKSTHNKGVTLVFLRSKSCCYIWCQNHYFFGLFL